MILLKASLRTRRGRKLGKGWVFFFLFPAPPPFFGFLPDFRIFPTLSLPASEPRTGYHFGNVHGQQMLIFILLYEGLKGKAVTDPSLCWYPLKRSVCLIQVLLSKMWEKSSYSPLYKFTLTGECEFPIDWEHAWAEALICIILLFSLAARRSKARRYNRLRSTSILISHRLKNDAT